MAATDEQLAVLDAFKTQEDCIVEAVAGAGKTSTLLGCAESDQRRGLYIAFNRHTADEARARFPANTDCRTAHSLAFRAIGHEYIQRMDLPRQRGQDRAEILGCKTWLQLPTGKPVSPSRFGTLAMDTVRRFCYSADEMIHSGHVPFVTGAEDCREDLCDILVPLARAAWNDIHAHDGRLRAEHDHYLKRWAMDDPKLGFDYVMMDEAQDANGVIEGLLLQQDCQRVWVGDSAQAIYGWRLAKDSLKRVHAKHRLTLSTSFRFGPPIADEANDWLEQLGSDLVVKGWDVKSEIRPIEAAKMFLCRTNAGVVERALQAQERDLRVAVIGGTDQIRYLALAAIDLQTGKGTSHADLFAFKTWDQVVDYCEQESDVGKLGVFVRLIDRYGANQVLDMTKRAVPLERADVVVSTVHGAKGLEFSEVSLHDDFLLSSSDEELRLAYVAVTRAQHVLDKQGLDRSVQRKKDRDEAKEAKKKMKRGGSALIDPALIDPDLRMRAMGRG